MISFDEFLNSDKVFSIAKKYFEKEDYNAFVNFIKGNFDKCPPEVKSELLIMLGIIYSSWGSYTQAIFVLKLAIKFNPKNSNAYLNLARVSKDAGIDDEFKAAFVMYSNMDYEGLIKQEDLINYFNRLNEQVDDTEFVLVDDDFRKNSLFEKATKYLDAGEIDNSIDCLNELVDKYPDFLPAYEVLTYIYLTFFDDDKLEKLAKLRFERFPDNVEAIALYLYTKRFDLSVENSKLMEKFFTTPINSMLTLKRVCEVFDACGKYSECLGLINDYAKNNNAENNYDILMMSLVANLKLQDKQTAEQLLQKVKNYYGILGVGLLYDYMKNCNADELKIVNFNCIASEMWDITNILFTQLFDKVITEKPVSDNEFWTVFELLLLTQDEDVIIKFLYEFKEQFTLKNAEKIVSILYLRQITNIVKAGVIYALLLCGVTHFTFLADGGINREKLLPISELDNYPECYRDAYYYAFAYCGLNTDTFADNVHQSAMELLETMKTSKRKFRDEFALAAVVICNSYVIVGENIVETVSKIVECNAKRVKSYINIIQKNGEFFDLEDDDIFEILIRRIANKITED